MWYLIGHSKRSSSLQDMFRISCLIVHSRVIGRSSWALRHCCHHDKNRHIVGRNTSVKMDTKKLTKKEGCNSVFILKFHASLKIFFSFFDKYASHDLLNSVFQYPDYDLPITSS